MNVFVRGFAAALALVVAVPTLAQAPATPHKALLAQAPSLLTVRYVLKVQTSGIERELDGETTCLLVSRDGWLLCSNNEMGSHVVALTQLMNRGELPGLAATPREIKVLLGSDAKGQSAKLVARDSDRDLAWLKLDAIPPGAVLEPLDLEAIASAEVGQPCYRLRRLDRFFGGAPMVESGVIGSVVDHPRHLLVAADLLGGHLGAPIFAADGRLLGVTITQLPGPEDRGALASSRGLPGQATKFDDMVGRMILPAAEVLRATRLAQEIYAADQAAAAAGAQP